MLSALQMRYGGAWMLKSRRAGPDELRGSENRLVLCFVAMRLIHVDTSVDLCEVRLRYRMSLA
jgi:hypothetical protein